MARQQVARVLLHALGEDAKGTGVPFNRYDAAWEQGYVYVQPHETKVADLLPLFRAAYAKLKGK